MTTSQAVIMAIGAKSKERQDIENKLKEGAAGDTLTRSDASEIMNMPCNSRSKGDRIVRVAISGLLRGDGPYWEWSRDKQCWVCLSDAQKVQSLDRRRKKTNKSHRRTIKASSLVMSEHLTDDQQTRLAHRFLRCAVFYFVSRTTDAGC